jgi:hypothetical protein
LRDAKNATREQAPSGLPVFLAPELTVGAEGTKPTRNAPTPPSKKNKNWLIDGVLSKGVARPDSSAANRSESLASELGAVDSSEAISLTTTKETSGGSSPVVTSAQLAASGPEADRRPTAPSFKTSATNPLDEFMRSWISPQDRQLLLPTEAWKGDAGGAAVAANASTVSLAQASSTFSGPESAHPSEVTNAPRSNPYIGGQSLASDFRAAQIPATTPAVSSDIVLRPSSSPSATVGEAPRPALNKPAVREFGKQDDNGKYFRQLNRF